MANQYKVEKLTQFNAPLDVYVVRNKVTGKVKYAMHMRYNADDLCKYANGRPSMISPNCLGVLTQARPERYGISCNEIES
jgi:hypothetical protein